MSCFEEKDCVFWNSIFCCLLQTPFFFVPLLSHTCFAALTIKPPDGEHATTDQDPTRQPHTTTSCQERGPESTTCSRKAASTRLKHVGWALPAAPQHCYGLQGNGCNSHWGELEYPVAAGHHNLGRVSLSLSCASKKAKNSFLDPGPSTNDTTMGSLQWATATSPLFQPQGIPSTPSLTQFSLPMQILCICTPYQAPELPSTSHCNRRKEQDRYVALINVCIHVVTLQNHAVSNPSAEPCEFVFLACHCDSHSGFLSVCFYRKNMFVIGNSEPSQHFGEGLRAVRGPRQVPGCSVGRR